MGLLLVSASLSGCASGAASERSAARVDTLYRDCPSQVCPPPVCPPPPDPRLARVGKGADTALWLSLDSLAEADYLAGGGVLGAMVVRVRDSHVVWSHQPDTRMLPASVQKVWAVGAALSVLGPDFRWRTVLWANGKIEAGVLRGDLILEGGGDPTLGSGDGPGLVGLANTVAKLGVREVRGNLVALDTLVGRGQDAWPQGWTISSSRDGYGGPVLGLNWNQNRTKDRSISEPRPMALQALRKALLLKKIAVTGTDTTVKVRGDSIGQRRDWTRLGAVPSPRLEDVARVCLRESVNPYAEAMVLALGMGRARMVPRDAGRKRLQEWAARMGFEPWRMVLDDGSGLSRYDLVTARLLARALAVDLHGPAGERLFDYLARGGTGTMRRRFKELPDPSIVVAKTGTLDGVANLAGIVSPPGRDTLAFAFLCGGYSGSARVVRKFQDRLLALVSGVPLRSIVPADTASDTSSVEPAASDSGKPVPPVEIDSARASTTDSVATGGAAVLPVGPRRAPSLPDSSLKAVPAGLDSIRRNRASIPAPRTESVPEGTGDDLSSFPLGDAVRDTLPAAP